MIFAWTWFLRGAAATVVVLFSVEFARWLS